MTNAKAKAPVVVVCGHCESTVAADVVGAFSPEADDPFDSYRVSVSRCPSCGEAIVASQEMTEDHFANLEWGVATRLWPKPENEFSDRIPANIRATLKQARSTFQVGAFDASVVMCRRAVEEVAHHFGAAGKNLYEQLEELNNAYVIDEKMLEWGHELRLEGNRGAHASDDRVSREDSKDLLEFTEAICSFVFVFTQQFLEFRERKEKRSASERSGSGS